MFLLPGARSCCDNKSVLILGHHRLVLFRQSRKGPPKVESLSPSESILATERKTERE